MSSIVFSGYLCELKRSSYPNGKLRLDLIDAMTSEPVATATVNYPGDDLGPSEVVIKTYSENSGILKALVEAGVVEPTPKVRAVGYELCPVARVI